MVNDRYLLSFIKRYIEIGPYEWKVKLWEWLEEESSENVLAWIVRNRGFNYIPINEMPMLLKLCSVDLGYYIIYKQDQQTSLLNHIVSLLNDRFITITEENINQIFDIGLYMTMVSNNFEGNCIDLDNFEVWKGLMRIDIDYSLHIMAFIMHYYKLGFLYRGRDKVKDQKDIHSYLYEKQGRKGYFFPLHYYKDSLC